jgi:hypothetical protein
VRSTDFVTQYPSQFTSVMAWDRDLMWDLEERIAQEFVGKGVNVELGPVSWNATRWDRDGLQAVYSCTAYWRPSWSVAIQWAELGRCVVCRVLPRSWLKLTRSLVMDMA